MTGKGPDIEFLIAHVSKYVSLTSTETTFFISLLRSRSLTPGEFLIHAGDVCKHESFVIRGCLKAYSEDEHGTERVLDFFVEEWWADDLYSFLTQTASKTSVVALENTDLLQIRKKDLELLYQKTPKFERFFRLLFQNAFIAQREQTNLHLFTPAEERYKLFLKKKPYAAKRFTQKDIASYLGVTPQFLSRLKKKLR
jgi:CRP-like cAMP-binding protein